jgi:hypothetical protein
MNKPKLRCPNCGCLSKFGDRTRVLPNDITEIYIMCPTCRWEKVVFSAHSSKIRQYKKLLKAKARSKDDPRQLRQIEQQLRQLNAETNK